MDGFIVVRGRFKSLMHFVVLLFLETHAKHLGSSFAYLPDHQNPSLLLIRTYVQLFRGFISTLVKAFILMILVWQPYIYSYLMGNIKGLVRDQE